MTEKNHTPSSEQITATTNMAQFSVGFSKTEGAVFQLTHSPGIKTSGALPSSSRMGNKLL